MRVRILYHDHCFDGAASAAFFSRFVEERFYPGAEFSFTGLAHKASQLFEPGMFDGDINNDSYAPEKFRDPRVLAFMRRITVSEDPALTARTSPSVVPTRITAIRGNVGKRWPKERSDDILQALWALDQANDLSVLLGKLSLR